MAFKDTKHKGFVSNYTGNGIHSFGAFQYFQINDPSGTLDPYTGQVKVLDIATKAGLYSSTDTGSNITEVVYDPFSLQISAENATLSNVTVWSANSILTQGRANSLYIAETAAVLVPVSYGNDLFYGHYQTKNRTGAFPYVSGGLLTGSNAMVGIANQSDPCNIEFWPGDIFNQMRFRAYNKSIVINNDGFSVETGTANWTWSDNSILTQGRGDSRYQPVGSYLANATTWLTTDSGTDQIIGLQSNTSTYQTFSGTGVYGSSYLGVRTLASNTGISYIKCDPTAAPFGRVTIFHNGTTFTFNSRGISVGSTANFTWGSNDFSTVGFNDARYQNATNNTYANLTGTPNLSLYLTNANAATTYLPAANFTYANIGGTIPTATNTTLGAVKVGSNLTIANGVLSATSSGGFQNGDTLNGGTY